MKIHTWVLLAVFAGCTASHTASTPAGATHAAALPFIEDDYPRALAEAKKRGLPLFVDAWAPWCHTCVFMREHVLTDPELAPLASKFVWLSIDTEKAQNVAFLEKFPIESWPTLFVIDAKSEQAALKWLGSLTTPQLAKLLEDGERALTQANPTGDATAMLAHADRLNGERKAAEAAKAYRAAIDGAPADWPQRSRAVESMIAALYQAKDQEACAKTAMKETPSMPRSPSFANAVAMGLWCTVIAGDKAPWHAEAVNALLPLLRESVALPGLLSDDRSGLYELLVELSPAAEKPVIAREWLAFLETEAAKAKTPEARTAFDSHVALAAIAAEEPARAIAPLELSERELPNDYNPAARLALVYKELGQYDAALAASNRALKKVYGPRKLRVLETKASIEALAGQPAKALQTLESALSYAGSLPEAQRNPKLVARIESELQKLKTK
jgi:tetratricopeptide (TPR) repeat protein